MKFSLLTQCSCCVLKMLLSLWSWIILTPKCNSNKTKNHPLCLLFVENSLQMFFYCGKLFKKFSNVGVRISNVRKVWENSKLKGREREGNYPIGTNRENQNKQKRNNVFFWVDNKLVIAWFLVQYSNILLVPDFSDIIYIIIY